MVDWLRIAELIYGLQVGWWADVAESGRIGGRLGGFGGQLGLTNGRIRGIMQNEVMYERSWWKEGWGW